jgi:hydroxyethylthiazole kinase-like uncharacterized protein yjeF
MDTLLYSCAQIRAIEHAAQLHLAPGELMERAGQAAAAFALELLDGEAAGAVLVLAGPGNNGGDGLELAAHLARAGADVEVLHLAGDAAPSFEAGRALQRARDAGARFVDDDPGGPAVAPGGRRPVRHRPRAPAGGTRARLAAWTAGSIARCWRSTCRAAWMPTPARSMARTARRSRPRIRSPSSATSPACTPATAATMPATSAWTCWARRPAPGSGPGCLNGPALFAERLAPRRRNSHKGSFGDVVVLGGARGMAGAAVLAARAALHGGAGRVFAAMLDGGMALDPLQPEIMFRDAAGMDFAGRSVVAGPGMGNADAAIHLFGKVLDAGAPLVVDADALNLAAARPELQGAPGGAWRTVVLTPHPLEAARLLGVTAPIVQADRLEHARELAMRFNSVVVLKGAGSVIARPDGFVAVNTSGNPGLATGGSGDVLAGFCGALLGQGWPAWEAALGAVWMHGAAADWLVEDGERADRLDGGRAAEGDAGRLQCAGCVNAGRPPLHQAPGRNGQSSARNAPPSPDRG